MMRHRSGSTRNGSSLRRSTRYAGTLAVAVLLSLGTRGAIGVAPADVPTVADIAGCNDEARDGIRGRAVAPTSRDVVEAATARKADAETAKDSGGAAAGVTQSPDPHIHGMDGEGAKDAAYRAVYRVCMRRNGF
jgi:hypothetical protein